MKAKVISTDEIVEIVEINAVAVEDSIPFVRYFTDDNGKIYDELQLEFESHTQTEVTIEGWVAVDEWGMGGCFLHSTEPESVAKEFCDTGEYEIYWVSKGEKYELDSKLFPDLTPESEPKRVKITITPIDQ